MSNSVYAALSGQMALRRSLDMIANNIANASTTGYKREGVQFAALFEELKTHGEGVSFAHDFASMTDLTQGALKETGNPLDVALKDSQSLFSVQTPQGTLYSRDGRLSVNTEGRLVLTATGDPILDNGGATITIPQGSREVTIASDGALSIDGQVQGRLGVFRVEAGDLERQENGFYKALAAPTPNNDMGVVQQGFIENSNVNIVQELTNMIKVQRAYEQGKGLIDSETDRINGMIRILGKSNSNG